MKQEKVDKLISELFNRVTDAQLEEGEITPERADIGKRKFELIVEAHHIQKLMDEVTDNDYIEIGNILNELHEKENAITLEAYEKCKKWLDDNNMPYHTECKDDNDNEEENEPLITRILNA